MKYTGATYRPPIENNSLLLQVTVGCTHNKCTFCTMYRDVNFSIEKIDQIEKDLKQAKQLYGFVKRVFLLNGDAFVLSPTKLKLISAKIIEYFPEVETITMYASIRNIKDKSDNDLVMLREARINDLWIGLESGNSDVINHFNKGYTLDDTYEQLERLNKAKIRHNSIFMIGAAGRGKGIKNAIDTANLVNRTRPQLVGISTLGLFPGSDLEREAEMGFFTPATELEILEEEKKLIELIELENFPFYGNHPTNSASITGVLPQDREKLLNIIDNSIRNSNNDFLNSIQHRSTL